MTLEQAPGRVPEMTVGVRLYMAREELGVDRGTFAARLGIDRNTITRYEGNRVVPREIVLRAWARETGVDLGWLRTGVPSEPSRPTGGGVTFLTYEAPRARLELATYGLREAPRRLTRDLVDVAAA